jgi:hypothetical protein
MEGKRKGDLKILAHHGYFFFSSLLLLLLPFLHGGSDTYIYLKNTLYVYRSIFKVSKSDHREYNID